MYIKFINSITRTRLTKAISSICKTKFYMKIKLELETYALKF